MGKKNNNSFQDNTTPDKYLGYQIGSSNEYLFLQWWCLCGYERRWLCGNSIRLAIRKGAANSDDRFLQGFSDGSKIVDGSYRISYRCTNCLAKNGVPKKHV